MKAKLYCKTGILSGKAIDIADGATIGKNAENHLVVDAQIISGRHARIHFDKNENCYFLEDLRSRNGTRLDGMPVTQKKKLGKIHVITFAENFDFIFQLIHDEAPSARPAEKQKPPAVNDRSAPLPNEPRSREKTPLTPGLGRTLIDDAAVPFPKVTKIDEALPGQDLKRTISDGEFTAMPSLSEAGERRAPAGLANQGPGGTMLGYSAIAAPNFQLENESTAFLLEVKGSGKEKQVFHLKEGENLIGHSQECAIRLDDSSLSPQHAVLTIKGGKITLRDLKSKKHTSVDKQRITSEVEIRPEMKLQFGSIKAQLIRKA